MPGRAVPMRVGDVELLVETMPVVGTEPTAGKLGRAQETVADAFERAQSAIVAVAESTVRTIGRLGDRAARPDEMQVTFGLKFSAQGNVIVAGATGEATLEVALTYRRETARTVAEAEAAAGIGAATQTATAAAHTTDAPAATQASAMQASAMQAGARRASAAADPGGHGGD